MPSASLLVRARILFGGPLAPLALALALVACSGGPQEVPARSSGPIVGGEPATDFEEAVLVDLLHQGVQYAACSGSVIAPGVVLTAGHCVVGATDWNVTAPYAGGQTVHASGGTTFDYDSTSEDVDPGEHDIGLVFLDSPIALHAYPAVAAEPLSGGPSVVNIGRIQDGQFSTTDLFVSSPIPVTDGSSVGYPYDYSATDVIEAGDSGGPDEVTGTSPHLIVSVNSGGGPTEVLARTDLVYGWIEQQIASHGGGGAPPSAVPQGGVGPAPSDVGNGGAPGRDLEPATAQTGESCSASRERPSDPRPLIVLFGLVALFSRLRRRSTPSFEEQEPERVGGAEGDDA
jgi:hypothetical protein